MTEVSELRRARREDEVDKMLWLLSSENSADGLTRPGVNHILNIALETGKLKNAIEQWIAKGNETITS